MKHARPDYDRIQDPAGLIPEDEPVFLIRGQDEIGAFIVRTWASHAEFVGASPEMIKLALDHADRMQEWRTHKVPDLPPRPTPEGSAS